MIKTSSKQLGLAAGRSKVRRRRQNRVSPEALPRCRLPTGCPSGGSSGALQACFSASWRRYSRRGGPCSTRPHSSSSVPPHSAHSVPQAFRRQPIGFREGTPCGRPGRASVYKFQESAWQLPERSPALGSAGGRGGALPAGRGVRDISRTNPFSPAARQAPRNPGPAAAPPRTLFRRGRRAGARGRGGRSGPGHPPEWGGFRARPVISWRAAGAPPLARPPAACCRRGHCMSPQPAQADHITKIGPDQIRSDQAAASRRILSTLQPVRPGCMRHSPRRGGRPASARRS